MKKCNPDLNYVQLELDLKYSQEGEQLPIPFEETEFVAPTDDQRKDDAE